MRKIFHKKLFNDISCRKVRYHCHYTGKYRGPLHSIRNLRFKLPGEIPVVFHNGFTVSIKKEVIKTDNDGKKSIETISYKIKFIDSIGFISSSLTCHVDNLSEIYNKKCIDQNCKSGCEFKGVNNNELFYDCKKCRKEQLKPMNELTKKFSNTYEYCNGDINKLI